VTSWSEFDLRCALDRISDDDPCALQGEPLDVLSDAIAELIELRAAVRETCAILNKALESRAK
jgi:hypothetical protein